MKDTEKATAVLAIADAKNFPLPADQAPGFDSAPLWAIDDPTVATIAPSADGLSCDVVAQKPGQANLSVSASLGGNPFAGALPVLVTVGDAATIAIVLGAAVPQ